MKSLDLKHEKKEIKTKFLCVRDDEICFFDDLNNKVYLKEYFIKNNISEKNRKIFFTVCNKMFYVEEFVTNLKFEHDGLGKIIEYINGHTLSGSSNKRKVIAEEEFERIMMDNLFTSQYYQGINFCTSINYADYGDLNKYFNILKKDNEFENYIKTITSFISDGLYYTSKRNINQRIEYDNINKYRLKK